MIEAIIYDFDGVIADSEAIANAVLADMVTQLGRPTTLQDSYRTYMGKRFEDAGVAAILFTDIDGDGLLKGVNVTATAALARALTIPVIASGGVGSIADIDALKAARETGVVTVGFTGTKGAGMKSLCDLLLIAPSAVTAQIQQIHITAGHAICGIVERDLFKAPE